MDQSGFYAVVSAINFTLLGLWWVAVKDRADLVGETASSRLTAYLVAQQFVIPGAVSLIAQVAPEVAAVWRSAFALAGVLGAVGVVMLVRELRRTAVAGVAPMLIALVGVPLYVAVALVAVLPFGPILPDNFTPIQVEALLLSLLVFLGVQEAWIVSMTPAKVRNPPTPDSSH